MLLTLFLQFRALLLHTLARVFYLCETGISFTRQLIIQKDPLHNV